MKNSEQKDENITQLNPDESSPTDNPKVEVTSPQSDELYQVNLKDEALYRERRKEYEVLTSQRKKLIYMVTLFTFSFFILAFASYTNQGLYKINDQTLTFINQSFNALVLLMIPFLLGSLGGFTRVLISGLKVSLSTTVIISSGLMAVFSWISIKSGVLVSLIAPHLNEKGVKIENLNSNTETEFYTMALVAIIVGMFSSNVYIYINEKVDQLTKSANNDKSKK